MFELSFTEIFLFAAIALVVLGPEKLPHAARIAGAWYARIRRQIGKIQAEIENEVAALEHAQKLKEELQKIQQTEEKLKQELADLQKTVYSGGQALKQDSSGGLYYYFLGDYDRQKLLPAAPLKRQIK